MNKRRKYQRAVDAFLVAAVGIGFSSWLIEFPPGYPLILIAAFGVVGQLNWLAKRQTYLEGRLRALEESAGGPRSQ